MINAIVINNQDLQIKEYNNIKILTFDDVDRLHQRPNGTAKRNFNANKQHFIENEDFFEISRVEFSTNFVPNSKIVGNPNLKVTLLTEQGYLMVVKLLTDKLAWQVQRALVNNYFRNKPNTQTLPQNNILQILQEQAKALINHNEILITQQESIDKLCVA